MTRQESRKAAASAAIGVAGLLGGAAITPFLAPSALPFSVCAGIAVFVLGTGAALRIARVDDIVFAHRPTWRAPNPPFARLNSPWAPRRRAGGPLGSVLMIAQRGTTGSRRGYEGFRDSFGESPDFFRPGER